VTSHGSLVNYQAQFFVKERLTFLGNVL